MSVLLELIGAMLIIAGITRWSVAWALVTAGAFLILKAYELDRRSP